MNLATINKKLDKILSIYEQEDWVSEEKFIERTGLNTTNKRYRYRQANPHGWKEGNGTYIYSINAWLNTFKSIKES